MKVFSLAVAAVIVVASVSAAADQPALRSAAPAPTEVSTPEEATPDAAKRSEEDKKEMFWGRRPWRGYGWGGGLGWGRGYGWDGGLGWGRGYGWGW